MYASIHAKVHMGNVMSQYTIAAEQIIFQAHRAHNFFKTYLVSKCKQYLLHVALVLRQFLQHFKEIILRPRERE